MVEHVRLSSDYQTVDIRRLGGEVRIFPRGFSGAALRYKREVCGVRVYHSGEGCGWGRAFIVLTHPRG